MKKLFVLLLLLAAVGASAQERDSAKMAEMKALFGGTLLCGGSEPPHSTNISLVAAPNWLFQSSPILDGGFEPRMGYSLGIDVARFLPVRGLQIKMGFRYNVWKSSRCSDLIFEDDLLNGPPYYPVHTCLNLKDRTWQYFAGLRWYPGWYVGRHWSGYADMEIGATDVVANSVPGALRFTAGLGAGMQWKPGEHFALFAQPGARYIFPNNLFSLRFLPLHLEMGVRWEW